LWTVLSCDVLSLNYCNYYLVQYHFGIRL
jgi:hypothetical protein